MIVVTPRPGYTVPQVRPWITGTRSERRGEERRGEKDHREAGRTGRERRERFLRNSDLPALPASL